MFGKIIGATTNDYFVEIRPLSDLDDDWVFDPSRHSWSMWADTARHKVPGDTVRRNAMFEWIDPMDGGLCGSLSQYKNGTGRQNEVHWDGPDSPPSGQEKHCIRPGRYSVFLWKGGVGTVCHLDANCKKEVVIDYIQSAHGIVVQDSSSSTVATQSVEPTAYSDSHGVHDFVLHFDLGSAGGSKSAALHLENSLSNPYDTGFRNQEDVSGSQDHYFRASVLNSTSGWIRFGVSGGAMAARISWDSAGPNMRATNWYNPIANQGIIRIKRYGDEVKENRDLTVGLTLMRPDEPPVSAFDDRRTITITRTAAPAVFADIRVENDSTWQTTDQYVTVGRSDRGSNIRYRWSFETGVWTSFTTDTLYDFSGHSTTGQKTVRLEVRNDALNESAFKDQVVQVFSGQMQPIGNSYITTKATYSYTSSESGNWFERFNPQLLWTRITNTPTSSIDRIWPAGEYTVELRQQDSVSQMLKRGRLSITVCTVSGCDIAASAAPVVASFRSTAEIPGGIFGAGPVISSGSSEDANVARMYDLMGLHDRQSFASREWLGRPGTHSEPFRLGTVDWNETETGIAGVKQYVFIVRSPTSKSYAFGFAFDPDLGENAADDLGGYDISRGMVYALDENEAIGVILHEDRTNAATSIWQYGAGRFSPSDPQRIWTAQRTAGYHPLAGKRDVQFLISAPEAAGSKVFNVIVVRGNNLEELNNRADLFLSR